MMNKSISKLIIFFLAWLTLPSYAQTPGDVATFAKGVYDFAQEQRIKEKGGHFVRLSTPALKEIGNIVGTAFENSEMDDFKERVRRLTSWWDEYTDNKRCSHLEKMLELRIELLASSIFHDDFYRRYRVSLPFQLATTLSVKMYEEAIARGQQCGNLANQANLCRFINDSLSVHESLYQNFTQDVSCTATCEKGNVCDFGSKARRNWNVSCNYPGYSKSGSCCGACCGGAWNLRRDWKREILRDFPNKIFGDHYDEFIELLRDRQRSGSCASIDSNIFGEVDVSEKDKHESIPKN